MYKLGILNPNGQIARPTIENVLPRVGKTLELVVFHRPGSNLDWLPKNIERRELDLEKETPDAEDIAIKLADIEVFISLLTTFAIAQEKHLVPALKASKKLVTFVPSHFGNPWTEEDLKTNWYMKAKQDTLDELRSQGIPVTQFVHGFVIPWGLKNGGMPRVSLKDNTITLYKDAEDKEFHYITPTRVAQALSDLLLSRQPSELANQTFSILQYHLTGKEYIQLLEKINGKAPLVTYYTNEQFDKDINAGEIYPLGTSASLLKLWKNGFNFPGEVLDPPDKEQSFEQLIRQGTTEKWC